jgi:hypothetical protein
MPLGVGQPLLAPQSSVMGEIFFLGLQADSTSIDRIKRLTINTDFLNMLISNGLNQTYHKAFTCKSDNISMSIY